MSGATTGVHLGGAPEHAVRQREPRCRECEQRRQWAIVLNTHWCARHCGVARRACWVSTRLDRVGDAAVGVCDGVEGAAAWHVCRPDHLQQRASTVQRRLMMRKPCASRFAATIRPRSCLLAHELARCSRENTLKDIPMPDAARTCVDLLPFASAPVTVKCQNGAAPTTGCAVV